MQKEGIKMTQKMWDELQLIFCLNKDTGDVFKIVGDDKLRRFICPEFQEMFMSSCISNTNRGAIPVSEAKMRVMRIMSNYIEKNKVVEIRYSELLKRCNSIVRSSAGLKSLLDKMAEDGIVNVFLKPGSRSLFVKMMVSVEDANVFINRDFGSDDAEQFGFDEVCDQSVGDDKDVEYATFDSTGLSQDEFEQRVKSQNGQEVKLK